MRHPVHHMSLMVCRSLGMPVQEFLVSPVQLGIPYSRPRYFAVMKQASAESPAVPPLQASSVQSLCSV